MRTYNNIASNCKPRRWLRLQDCKSPFVTIVEPFNTFKTPSSLVYMYPWLPRVLKEIKLYHRLWKVYHSAQVHSRTKPPRVPSSVVLFSCPHGICCKLQHP